MDLNGLPQDLEDIILKYKYQLDLAEKIKKLNNEFHTKATYIYVNQCFSYMRIGHETRYYYYSEYFNRLILVDCPNFHGNMWAETTRIRYFE